MVTQAEMAHKVSLYMVLATTEPMVAQAEMAVVLEQVVAIYNIGDNGAGGEKMAKMSVVLERAKVMRLNKVSLYIILATTGPVVKR